MKRTVLVKQLTKLAKANRVAFTLTREGANHEVWSFAGQAVTIPRHREINELTAKGIIRTCEQATDNNEGEDEQ